MLKSLGKYQWILFFSSEHDTEFYLGCKWCKCFAGETTCYETGCIDQYASAEVKSQFTGAKLTNYKTVKDQQLTLMNINT